MLKKILLVDDEESILNSLSDALNSIGYEVIQGHNGEEAIELFDKEKPDLVLLDVRMPIKSGIDAYGEIISKHNNAKIIFMSAYPIEKELYNDVKNRHMMYFLNKPFSMQMLKDILAEIIPS